MASAVLSSRRDEPRWPEPAVYMKKHPPFNPNPNPTHANPNNHRHTTVGALSDRHVTLPVSSCSRAELRELKRRLVSELEQVRSLLARIESGQPGSATVVHPERSVEQVSSPAASALVSANLKKCGQILTRLMKHKKNVWFNAPVDAAKMGLHDYHQIVKQPMDLGSVKSKLSKGSYVNLSEFASDVRLTFNNALLYNPRGHVVHELAEELLGLFEKLFSPIFDSYKLQLDSISEKHVPVNHIPSRPQLQAQPPHVAPVKSAPAAARPVPKQPKPKARDPNKRPMTYEEKQRLSEGLQSLPDEKMTQLVGIVRKRNLDTTQHGDEIELDIDSMDNETLWELDRFVNNCKKAKNRRKEGEGESMGNVGVGLPGPREAEGVATSTADMAASSDARTAAVTVAGSVVTDRVPEKNEMGEEDVDIGDEMPAMQYPPVEIQREAAQANSSSSSDSGSSSSDSDSSSSSSSGSDESGTHSPAPVGSRSSPRS